MKLTVFKLKYADRIITLFDRNGFCHFVDGVHLDDERYLTKNFTGVPHRLVYLSGCHSDKWQESDGTIGVDFGEVEDYANPKTPDFVIYFNEFEELDASDWFFLQTYFERLFNDQPPPMITRHRDFLLCTATRADELTWYVPSEC